MYGGQDARLAALILAFSSALGGASSSGSLANIVDLSPNFAGKQMCLRFTSVNYNVNMIYICYAGAILGMIKTLSMFPGVLSPMVAAMLTKHSVSFDVI
jgi:hypothetical protein